MKKRGLSPVVASVLLVAIVIVIGLIVFLWFRGISEEAITKFDGTNVKLVCEEADFDANFAGGIIYVSNTGNVPIYKMKAKVFSKTTGSQSTEYLGADGSWPELGINQGGTYSGAFSTPVSGDSILLVPVLIGKSEKGDKSHTCEDRHGLEIIA